MKSLPLLLALFLVPCVHAQTTSPALDKALADLDKRLRIDPKDAEAYHERGCVYFKLGNFKESVRDFDKYAEFRPEHKAGYWQRGISFYYAGLYDDGRRQFESSHKLETDDVENALWQFMCIAKAAGLSKARRDMLPLGDDRRVPMRQVYELFKGKLEPAEVLAAARGAGERPGDKAAKGQKQALFYGHLYAGIYYDLKGDASLALAHLNQAVNDYPISHYMWDVARVQRDVLRKARDK